MTLEAIVQQHCHQLESLQQLLHDERQQISHGQIDGNRLAAIARDKQQCLEEVDRLENQRRQLQIRLGFEDNRSGDQQAARSGGYSTLWQKLMKLAGEALTLNQRNGDMIRIRSESNQRLLNALQEAVGKSLYGPDGRARNRTGRVDARA